LLLEAVLLGGAPAAFLWNGIGLAKKKIGPSAGWTAIGVAAAWIGLLAAAYFGFL